MDFISIGVGLAIGLAAIGTGIAMRDIGTAAVGAMAEKPELFVRGLILTALPETILILGLVVALTMAGFMHASKEKPVPADVKNPPAQKAPAE